MRRFHIYIGFIVWLLTSLFAVSCNDELEGDGYSFNSSSNLHVLVPTILNSRGAAMSSSSSEAPTYNATVDECQINDLRLYAFPVGTEGKLVVENLQAPAATSMLNQNAAEYQLTITPGTYHIYVVANLSDVLSGQPIETEKQLKEVVLNYGVGTKPGMPVCTNIPMIYEPKDINGDIIETKITPTGNKYTEVIANMKFTCVKVKLNLIFDPTQADVKANFGGKSIYIDNIVANKLSPFTNLYWGGKFVEESLADGDYKTGISSTQYTSGSDAPAVYYTDWEDHTSEAETNNKNDIVGKGDATSAPVDAAKKWLFQNTFYLPERYISSAADRSYLTINGKVATSASNDYRIDLGHKKDEPSASEVPTFPRGTYYEITGKIKSLGNMELNCNVSIKPWESLTINADFNHTTLWVSKTETEVTSTEGDTISYKSSEAVVGFGCIDSKIVGEKEENVIIETKRDGNNIIFGINPNIPIEKFPKDPSTGKREGTTKVYLMANNIKKYINVHYDVTPYFKVSPKNVVIYYGKDPDRQQVLEKHFVVETNLGGLKAYQNINGTLTEKVSGSTAQVGNAPSRLQISYDNIPVTENGITVHGKYVMKVKETEDPKTTTIYNFTLSPLNNISDDEVSSQEVTVTVKPEFGPYRIYMRAINDVYSWSGAAYTDTKLEAQLKEQLPEYTGTGNGLTDNHNYNWDDGWFWENNKWAGNEEIHTAKHHMYMYTQMGENISNTPDMPTWVFTSSFPGNEMIGDVNNAGWYYIDMDKDAKSSFTENKAEGKKSIKPGQTLVMFGNGENASNGGCTPHRFPHHMDAGIPLFNYEDREGWYLYDPTCIPYYKVFDDKPTIVNVNYVIYTKSQITCWFIEFGCKGTKNTVKDGSYTLICWPANFKEHHTDVGNGWYRSVINLKAPKGEYEKAIKISFGVNNDHLLFNGDSYKCTYDATNGYQIFGYYDGSSWHEGKP